jgi:hypothetical protein
MEDFDRRMAEARAALAGGKVTTVAYLLGVPVEDVLRVWGEAESSSLPRGRVP